MGRGLPLSLGAIILFFLCTIEDEVLQKEWIMLRVRKSLESISYWAICLLALCLGIGCDAQEFSIQLQGVNPLDTSSCGPKKLGQNSFLLSRGTVDLVLANDYEVNLSVINLLQDTLQVNNLNTEDGYVNTTDINLTNAVIRYIDIDEVGLGLEETQEIPLAGLLQSGSINPVNQKVTVLTSTMSNNLRDGGLYNGRNGNGRIAPTRGSYTLVAAIKLQGKTLDGKRVESNEINFPIDLCAGCRVSTQGRGDACAAISDDETDLLTVCPSGIGRDNTYASCALCKQVAVNDSFAPLCED
jgi:hypothetical protein